MLHIQGCQCKIVFIGISEIQAHTSKISANPIFSKKRETFECQSLAKTRCGCGWNDWMTTTCTAKQFLKRKYCKPLSFSSADSYQVCLLKLFIVGKSNHLSQSPTLITPISGASSPQAAVLAWHAGATGGMLLLLAASGIAHAGRLQACFWLPPVSSHPIHKKTKIREAKEPSLCSCEGHAGC